MPPAFVVSEVSAPPTPLPPTAPKLVVPDYAYTTKVQPEIADWWKKTIQHT